MDTSTVNVKVQQHNTGEVYDRTWLHSLVTGRAHKEHRGGGSVNRERESQSGKRPDLVEFAYEC